MAIKLAIIYIRGNSHRKINTNVCQQYNFENMCPGESRRKIRPENVTHRVIYDDQCYFIEKANDENLFLEINDSNEKRNKKTLLYFLKSSK